MSLAKKLRKVADRLDNPVAVEARRLKLPLDLFELFERIKALTPVRTVFDVGANSGQFSRACALRLPGAVIHAFEPLAVCQEGLRKVAVEFSQIKVHQLALGESAGTVEMFQNDFNAASSLLPMGDRHRELWPHTVNTTKISVPLDTLDAAAARLGAQGPAFLKLDVQGFELHVLRGATNTLRDTAVVMMEVLFENLYEGQADFRTLLNFMAEHGFRFLEFADERRWQPLNQVVYADAVFVKQDLKFT
ncbi:MAG: FkbM family methyltransferase [Verrucomicrobia bacterium]|nr:FkbM family methyltransferase [Verrucomicrobiota bacterium]